MRKGFRDWRQISEENLTEGSFRVSRNRDGIRSRMLPFRLTRYHRPASCLPGYLCQEQSRHPGSLL
jgi:hypothetical protein